MMQCLCLLGNWDVFLPIYEFALHFAHSANTKQLPTFIDFGQGPNLSLEFVVCDVNNFQT